MSSELMKEKLWEIEQLQARIAELEAVLDKAAHQLYDYSGSCPSDLYDWEHPNTCIRECDRYDSPDEAWKCWRLWLMSPSPPEELFPADIPAIYDDNRSLEPPEEQ
jgi:hypothetical protein